MKLTGTVEDMTQSWPSPPVRVTPLVLRGRRFDAEHPAVMGIVNRTPDSFYAAARFTDLGPGLVAVDRLVAEGADLIDVGGVRAGQEGEEVDAAAEIERVRPFLLAVRERHPELLLSLDTWRSEVALACGEARIDLVNDTWAGADPELVAVAAELQAGYVVSHTGGLPPRTDPVNISYGDSADAVVQDVLDTLRIGAATALQAGIPVERILIDPTLDFGKTTRTPCDCYGPPARSRAWGTRCYRRSAARTLLARRWTCR